uniref:Ldh family oxidoreductase n=1 Tax=Mesorhizobium sp. WSM4875 TaxID=3038539 RepID=UPI002415ABDC|nr:Ldh family oxidoreductase [Mesorhizobium sp. WSM4875]WIE94814.1 Ldh family oxidoreductase [Mesorhizobium sp. WSM4875]
MIPVEEIRTTALRALTKGGLSLDHATIQLDLLLDAEMRGVPSHGLLRVPRVIERVANGVTDPTTKGAQSWRGRAFLDVDGKQGLGPVVALLALETARDRAAETGSCVVAVRNCDHLGMLAFYAEKLASEGKVLLGMTISEALVHPFGGRQAMLGTNPITIGVPAEPLPFVFDMATSLVSMGKIHDHAHRGVSIPEGWALDAEGNSTTDPDAAKLGAIAPFGGAKGYGLGLAFEVLVSALTGSAIGTAVKGTLDSMNPCNKGDVFVVMEPALSVVPLVSGFLEDIRHSAPVDPAEPVRIPGDRAVATRERASREGLTVASEVWDRIRLLAEV